MMRSIKRLTAALVGLTLTTGAAFAQSQETVVRLNDYPGIGNPMARVMVDQKLCEKQGFRCTLQTIPSAALAMQALLAGSLDVASVGAETGLLAASKGAKVKVFGAALVNTNFFFAVGNHLGPQVTGQKYPEVVKSLKGKRIGVAARGSAAEYQFASLAAGAGLKTEDFTMVAVGGPDTAFAALANKQIDGLLGFEPVAGMCQVLGACTIAVDMRKGEGPKELVALNGASAPNFVRAEFARDNPKVLAGLAAAFAEAEGYFTNPSHFDELVSMTEKYFPMNHPKRKEIISTALQASVGAVRFRIDPKSLQAISDYMQRTGQLPASFDTAGLLLTNYASSKTD
ncbi:ABC transporter substrate-binding protein [Variovorax dokdonensis]|uniref:ABC transporter substrate-binding protein n=1 Tax=Variovorax dokdonensis TaxID=344883 RepID=A0ABT7N7K1_9BURK|nr:ABC transporter substrate-binding protein [Variovorax dokdonensis]MDM0043905.1 ABC transporter substrate-binding protein [Variovorax dokdonensis]